MNKVEIVKIQFDDDRFISSMIEMMNFATVCAPNDELRWIHVAMDAILASRAMRARKIKEKYGRYDPEDLHVFDLAVARCRGRIKDIEDESVGMPA